MRRLTAWPDGPEGARNPGSMRPGGDRKRAAANPEHSTSAARAPATNLGRTAAPRSNTAPEGIPPGAVLASAAQGEADGRASGGAKRGGKSARRGTPDQSRHRLRGTLPCPDMRRARRRGSGAPRRAMRRRNGRGRAARRRDPGRPARCRRAREPAPARDPAAGPQGEQAKARLAGPNRRYAPRPANRAGFSRAVWRDVRRTAPGRKA